MSHPEAELASRRAPVRRLRWRNSLGCPEARRLADAAILKITKMSKKTLQPLGVDTKGIHDDSEPWLQSRRPPYENLRPCLRLVDLFCGCGAMSLGVAEAARRSGLGIDIRLAIDVDPDAVAVFSTNFKGSSVETGSVEQYFDGELQSALTEKESHVRSVTGPVDVLVGGPPCQGHSNLNNHTRRKDSRNAVYTKMARAAKVLRPRILLIENVPTVRHDVRQVVGVTIAALRQYGYSVDDRVLDVSKLGVPQRRKRHVVLALRGKKMDPSKVLDYVESTNATQTTVRNAIEDLIQSQPNTLFDTPSRANSENQARMAWLIEQDAFDLPNSKRPKCHWSQHSYNAMYGRLRWDLPAQTVTTGFNCMGQGRYVHPALPRTLTPHEAARLQSIPDFWDLSAARTRSSLARLIGNAVPPPLSEAIIQCVLSLHPDLVKGQLDALHTKGQPAPHASSPGALARMRAIRQQGTAVEMAVRRELDSLGLVYTTDERPESSIPRRADMVFRDSQIAVFVDGCFWHGCPLHASEPKSNAGWWADKLKANQQRDRDTDSRLSSRGWKVLRFWEHEDPPAVALAVASAMKRD